MPPKKRQTRSAPVIPEENLATEVKRSKTVTAVNPVTVVVTPPSVTAVVPTPEVRPTTGGKCPIIRDDGSVRWAPAKTFTEAEVEAMINAAIAKLKKPRKPKVLADGETPKPRKPRAPKEPKPVVPLVYLDAHSFDNYQHPLPANYECSSCKASHFISDFVTVDVEKQKAVIHRTCAECRLAGKEFYRKSGGFEGKKQRALEKKANDTYATSLAEQYTAEKAPSLPTDCSVCGEAIDVESLLLDCCTECANQLA